MRSTVTALIVALLGATAAQAQGTDESTVARLDRLQTSLIKKVTPAVVGLTCAAGEYNYYGTGAIIDARGWVLTNVSVVPPAAKNIKVYFTNHKTYKAKVVEYDVKTEGILLAIEGAEGTKFPYLPLADSKQAKLGQRVYTFGNPFNVIETEHLVPVGAGAISALGDLIKNGQEARQSAYTGPIIETDAAINPGSDGGPLVDAGGRLLGIISLAYAKERMLGLCIPASHIASKLKALSGHKLLPPPLEPISARSLLFGRHAKNLAKGVVRLEIERAPEERFKMPSDAEFQKMAQERGMTPSQLGMFKIAQRLKELMQRPIADATGIGVTVGDQHYVLTSNFHLTHNMAGKPNAPAAPLIKKILVHADGLDAPLSAEVVSRFNQWDLCLLKLSGKLPHTLELAKNPEISEGTCVAVLGRQAGVTGVSMTEGVVSATQRNHSLVKVYQCDALINYANLGGPIVDIEGRVIGVATFLNPDAGFGLNSGVALFTGSDTIHSVIARMAKGESERNPTLPFLGIRGWEERSIGGAMVAAVYGGSAAQSAGVKAGDLIISLDGKPIGEWPDLIRTITSKAVGQKIEFEVKRNGKKLKLEATLGKRTWE